jgi:hypothetical protein
MQEMPLRGRTRDRGIYGGVKRHPFIKATGALEEEPEEDPGWWRRKGRKAAPAGQVR